MKKYLYILLLAGTVQQATFAQSSLAERDACIAKLKQFFNHDRKTLSYQYQVVIAGTNEKTSQTLHGTIQIAGQTVYDSSQAYIQVKNKEYVFQLNKESKTVTLVNFERYKKLTGMDINFEQKGLMVNIPVEALDSAINFTQQGEIAEFQFKKPLYGIKFIKFKMVGNQVKEVEMSMAAAENNGDNILYNLKLFNIRHTVNEALFNHSRFYKVINGKVQYASPYRQYQHYEVI